MNIRDIEPSDAAAVAAIYNPYIRSTIITFEEEPLSVEEMAARIEKIRSLSLPWLAAEENGLLAGYAYASRWRERTGYRHSVETTIYLGEGFQGRGIGLALYAALLERLRRLPVHAVLGGIALPNDASVRLHEKMGFEKTAHFRQVGFKFGRWIDVGYWELILYMQGND